jgi:hypothetical protein
MLQIVEPKLGHGLAMAHSWLNKITWLMGKAVRSPRPKSATAKDPNRVSIEAAGVGTGILPFGENRWRWWLFRSGCNAGWSHAKLDEKKH